MMPDWTTFNGYANQYVTHPLTADPGETDALLRRRRRPHVGPPSTSSARSSTGPGSTGTDEPPQRGVQTVGVPPGGGGIFDVKIDEPGLYPFV